ncbi:MAG TPA: DUF6496 domain-containing protein [Dongiaceae bacterium]|jgi:hypothetical protein|nr:DUF6496 domain-containing protein [Dongiaceae bacterium]
MAKKKAGRKSSSRKKSSSRTTGRKKSAKRKSRRKYGAKASETVERAMHKRKHGTLRSGRGGKGGKVKSRKQAIAIGLSEAREKGAKVPEKKS